MIFRLFLVIMVGTLLASTNLYGQRVYASHSVLAAGNWTQIGVTREGVFKVTATALAQAGISSENISSNSIRLFGNGGAMLPENNREPRADDLTENALEMVDGGDGIFNGTDYFLFYSTGPHPWIKDTLTRLWQHQTNLYSDTAYYYLTIGGNGRRISPQTAQPAATVTVREMDDRFYQELELENVLASGKNWLGTKLGAQPGQSLTTTLSIPFTLMNTQQPVTLISQLAARSVGAPTTFRLLQQSLSVQETSLPAVSGQFLETYATQGKQLSRFLPAASSNLSIQIQMASTNPAAIGWIDWIEVFARRQLAFAGSGTLFFRDTRSVNSGATAAFEIQQVPTGAGAFVWDVTNPFNPVKMNTTQSGNLMQWVNGASTLREYAAGILSALPEPILLGKVANQDLHNSSPVRMLVITQASLLSEANRLAEYHRVRDGISAIVVTTQQIYHEFSGGNPDPTALRDFVKMYYDKARSTGSLRPEYLLLLGSGSYDYKRKKIQEGNLVPVYESPESLDPLRTYTSDDFFGLLDDGEDFSAMRAGDGLDIAIGRLPAVNLAEATRIVNKIIRYQQPASQGSWRMQTLFIADDRDNNLHFNDAQQITASAFQTNPLLNIQKVYLDAFPIISSSGGDRYPQVNETIVNQCFRGALVVNYTGHGNYLRLADEAVFTAEEVKRFNNPNRLPLFITASCDFAPHDNPAVVSLGDRVLKNDSTGGIALLTTTRPVFAYSNLQMNDQYLKVGMQKDAAGNYLSLGKSVLLAKNTILSTTGDVLNNRKFTLLGDPALTLAFPKNNIRLTRLNGKPITGNDTLKALGRYTCEGELADSRGVQLTNFNGIVELSLYDQPQLLKTLGNRSGSTAAVYNQQTSVLFRGTATVQGGKFRINFVVPKDISYALGKARFSMYATGENADAGGVDTSISIGGILPVAGKDEEGPAIRLYLNDTAFREGGLSNESPLLIALLEDSSGINASGNGIGHDITAWLDENTQNSFVLNEYYQADIDSYQKGKLAFRLPELAEGRHQITLKAWDLANNSSLKTLEFWVKKQEKLVFGRVMNYPNPFSSGTTFSVEHNRPGVPMRLEITIYDILGRLVRQIQQPITGSGSRNIQVQWTGEGASGAKLAKGIYIYHLKLISEPESASASGQMIRY